MTETLVVPERVKKLPLYRGMHVGVMFLLQSRNRLAALDAGKENSDVG